MISARKGVSQDQGDVEIVAPTGGQAVSPPHGATIAARVWGGLCAEGRSWCLEAICGPAARARVPLARVAKAQQLRFCRVECPRIMSTDLNGLMCKIQRAYPFDGPVVKNSQTCFVDL
jgi:hypothetical protein